MGTLCKNPQRTGRPVAPHPVNQERIQPPPGQRSTVSIECEVDISRAALDLGYDLCRMRQSEIRGMALNVP